jgi:hypothetical protein
MGFKEIVHRCVLELTIRISGYNSVVGFCHHGNESSESIKAVYFLTSSVTVIFSLALT